MKRRWISAAAAVICAGLAAGCAPQTATSPQPRQHVTTSKNSSATPAGKPQRHRLAAVHDPGEVTGSLTGPCRTRDGGRLPDPTCTPGAYDPTITAAILCAPGYRTSGYRPPESQTERFKFDQAYHAYGIPDGTRSELDHLVPLELGGANDAANLWPEVGTIPNAKDTVERHLHDAVCSGRATLAAARLAVAVNWESAESRLGIG